MSGLSSSHLAGGGKACSMPRKYSKEEQACMEDLANRLFDFGLLHPNRHHATLNTITPRSSSHEKLQAPPPTPTSTPQFQECRQEETKDRGSIDGGRRSGFERKVAVCRSDAPFFQHHQTLSKNSSEVDGGGGCYGVPRFITWQQIPLGNFVHSNTGHVGGLKKGKKSYGTGVFLPRTAVAPSNEKWMPAAGTVFKRTTSLFEHTDNILTTSDT